VRGLPGQALDFHRFLAARHTASAESAKPASASGASCTLYAVYLPNRHPAPGERALIDSVLETMGGVPPRDRDEAP
jgi:hypothetical protein